MMTCPACGLPIGAIYSRKKALLKCFTCGRLPGKIIGRKSEKIDDKQRLDFLQKTLRKRGALFFWDNEEARKRFLPGQELETLADGYNDVRKEIDAAIRAVLERK